MVSDKLLIGTSALVTMLDYIFFLYIVINQKQSVGEKLEKIVASYEIVYNGYMDEDAVLTKCRSAISSVEKTEKEIGGDYISGTCISNVISKFIVNCSECQTLFCMTSLARL